MKRNKFVKRALIVIIAAILATTALVYFFMYTRITQSLIYDFSTRTYLVQSYLGNVLGFEDFVAVSRGHEYEIDEVREKLLDARSAMGAFVGIQQLYIAYINSDGNLSTSLLPGEYLPTGHLLSKLHQSFDEVAFVTSDYIYTSERGAIFGSYRAVVNRYGIPVGVICIELDVTAIYDGFMVSLMHIGTTSLIIIIIASVISYLIMVKASDNIYKIMAYSDILTGYENRMAFESKLKKCDILAKEGNSVTVMVFDVNNLKIVNDTLGHNCGDELIKNTADIISEHIGEKKALYRIGGDEFGALLVNYSWEKVSNILKAIRSESRNVLKDVPFSCAVGMSRYDKSGDSSIRDAFLRADDSMYEDKQRSKGVVNKELSVDVEEKNNVDVLREMAKSEIAQQ